MPLDTLTLIGGVGFTTAGLQEVFGALGLGVRRLDASSCIRTKAEVVTTEAGAALARSLRQGGACLEELGLAECRMSAAAAAAVTGALGDLATAGRLSLHTLCLSHNPDVADRGGPRTSSRPAAASEPPPKAFAAAQESTRACCFRVLAAAVKTAAERTIIAVRCRSAAARAVCARQPRLRARHTRTRRDGHQRRFWYGLP